MIRHRHHDNCFSSFPRTSRDDPSRSTMQHLYGPFTRKSALRESVEDCAMLAVGAAFFAGLAFAPAIWSLVAGS